MRENRETPIPPTADGAAGRSEKADRPKSGMYGVGESDDLVVPPKRANKAGPLAAAEPVEGRGSTKGNVFVGGRTPDTVPDWCVVRPEGVRQAHDEVGRGSPRDHPPLLPHHRGLSVIHLR